jgi:glycerophosphoryl diester phosphodiesterase
MILVTLLYILIAHYTVSTIFLIFPNFLKKERKQNLKIFQYALDKKKFLRFSHRGGPIDRLENTIPAFKHSFEHYDCEFAELDVHMTKDKKMVVFHDKELLRIFGKETLISESIYDKDFLNAK